jgi:hypothetical protein
MIGLNDVTNGSRPVCENLDDEARIFITFRFRTLSPILNFAVMRHVYQRLRVQRARVRGTEFQTETISTRRSQTDPIEKQPTVAYSHIS